MPETKASSNTSTFLNLISTPHPGPLLVWPAFIRFRRDKRGEGELFCGTLTQGSSSSRLRHATTRQAQPWADRFHPVGMFDLFARRQRRGGWIRRRFYQRLKLAMAGCPSYLMPISEAALSVQRAPNLQPGRGSHLLRKRQASDGPWCPQGRESKQPPGQAARREPAQPARCPGQRR